MFADKHLLWIDLFCFIGEVTDNCATGMIRFSALLVHFYGICKQ